MHQDTQQQSKFISLYSIIFLLFLHANTDDAGNAGFPLTATGQSGEQHPLLAQLMLSKNKQSFMCRVEKLFWHKQDFFFCGLTVLASVNCCSRSTGLTVFSASYSCTITHTL